ncbi:hypothetical protein GCM10009665_43420 [Kitasatospora nipponensis]|uniref:ABC transporter n=1 Tax=Kitasatospora nipponensis TaxID=258049 RepID=A0ABN1WKX7_9ACTN
MIPLVRYHLELLVRSQRWLPPFLTYVLLMLLSISGSQAMLDSLGYAAALLVPVTAWYVRCALTTDPPAARACLVAAVGAVRVQVASLLAGLLAGLVPAVLGVLGIWLISERTTVPRGGEAMPTVVRPEVAQPAAAGAGLLAAVACVLVGVVVGALCHRPVLLRGSYGILATLGLSVAVLVTAVSPANRAVSALVTAARTARLEPPVAAPLAALVLAALAVAGTAALAARRTE